MIGGQQTLVSLCLIGLAGAIGAVARYMLGRLITQHTKSPFPWGTLLVNLSGAFLIGLLLGLTQTRVLTTQIQTILATGFLGGYTTFSTMAWEGVQLGRSGNLRLSLLYLIVTFGPGLLAAALGLLVGELL